VFFESPRRVAGLLEDLAAVLGPREAAVARELTKMFETVRRGPLPALAAEFAAGEPPRGEIVVLVGPPAEDAPALDGAALDERIRTALRSLSVKDAASVVSGETGQPRRKVYARAIELAADDATS
jgi:16S rRNA (cytidine1402-2'-O)-methyltransferase